MKHMKKKPGGFTLIELMIVAVIAAAAMLGISFMLVNAHKDLRTSSLIKALQEDMHLASYTVKSIVEEADSFEIHETGTRISVGYVEEDGEEDSDVSWEKEIYQDDNQLKLDNIDPDTGTVTESAAIISTLDSISFEDFDSDTVRVSIAVSDTGMDIPPIGNEFLVHLRN
jgi:prepilin-type N-terminal cleavage/methylation domain-containing protein